MFLNFDVTQYHEMTTGTYKNVTQSAHNCIKCHVGGFGLSIAILL